MVEDFYNSVTQMHRVSKSALDEDLKEICEVSLFVCLLNSRSVGRQMGLDGTRLEHMLKSG